MNKRDFIKTGAIGVAGMISMPAWGKKGKLLSDPQEFTIPDLPYAYDALEPHIDKETMMIHHQKHHAGYASKLNMALKDSGVAADNAWKLLREASKYNEAIINNAGGVANHNIFWKCLSPKGGGNPSGEIATLVDRDFGSYDAFKEKFSSAAKTVFGSGWAWLVIQDGKLKVVTTDNQDNPVMDTVPSEVKGKPLLCVDVWEHAYYLKYKNKRADYVDSFWNIVNWEFVSTKLSKINKAG
jgi:superoxide dismutase, Fe-Mn family